MCCGKKRAELTMAGATNRAEPAKASLPTPAVYFRYFGTTAMTAVGSATGRAYRFSAMGATNAVDPRDAPSLAGVPNLRRLASPSRSTP
jgi:hypothetical protein